MWVFEHITQVLVLIDAKHHIYVLFSLKISSNITKLFS